MLAAIGGVCAFAVENPDVKIYCDQSMRRFETVFPACGSGFTIVMVTHNLNIAEMAKTVIKMNSGKITDIYENKTQKTAYEIGW